MRAHPAGLQVGAARRTEPTRLLPTSAAATFPVGCVALGVETGNAAPVPVILPPAGPAAQRAPPWREYQKFSAPWHGATHYPVRPLCGKVMRGLSNHSGCTPFRA
ncbi:hypothetical protein FDG2_5447 [Candidatus Protofrankia californiensis]|uniref:Uncharacterized protein n=1 Tax=Candidatus Protofrankia californiensis TaxID=1839754 RepID=A0A1C3PDD0_9ACTN|nr:hypothetical protein FDG2_5447 [Candidatus Protofrankia californiensis]